MKVNGSCHCGQIAYEADVDPERVGVCNCTHCQVLTRSAFRVSVPAAAQTFRLLTGHPKIYIKTAESGNRRAHAFCPDCGTPPARKIWCRSALPWSMDLTQVSRTDQG